MTGYLLLEGGAEFGGLISRADLQAIQLAGGPDAPITIIPTAAAPRNDAINAGNNGIRWFQNLGATRVESLPLVDKVSANDPNIAASIRQSRLIYMLGGSAAYLCDTLRDSASWQAMLAAYESGAVLAGSSAGAMILCQYYYDPGKARFLEGLGLLLNSLVLPHHNTFGAGWARLMTVNLPDAVLIGIDERTGMLDDGEGGRRTSWHVYGQGAVTLYRHGEPTGYGDGEGFEYNFAV